MSHLKWKFSCGGRSTFKISNIWRKNAVLAWFVGGSISSQSDLGFRWGAAKYFTFIKIHKFMKSNVLSISKKSYISYIKIFVRIWSIFPQTLVKLTQMFFVVQGTEATIVTGGHLSWAAWSIWNVQGHEKHKDYSLWICWTLPKQYNTRMLNVWYIYLHLPPKLPECR